MHKFNVSGGDKINSLYKLRILCELLKWADDEYKNKDTIKSKRIAMIADKYSFK